MILTVGDVIDRAALDQDHVDRRRGERRSLGASTIDDDQFIDIDDDMIVEIHDLVSARSNDRADLTQIKRPDRG